MSTSVHSSPQQKAWYFSDTALQGAQGPNKDGYEILRAPKEEVARVNALYQQHPVSGWVIKRVDIIHNSQMQRLFEGRVDLLERRQGKAGFVAKWENECADPAEKEHRRVTLTLLKSMAYPYQDSDNPHVSILPLWHGTTKGVLQDIFTTGFANLATTDSGFFGKGLYNTGEAEYARRVYSDGSLLVNWVAVYSVLPVIHGDMEQLKGKGNYQNYDGHFAPVVPRNANDPHESIYHPCKPSQKHTYTELVVFESSQVLPRYLVELQPALPVAPPGVNTGINPNTVLKVNDLVAILLKYQKTLDDESEEYALVDQKIDLYDSTNRDLNPKEISFCNFFKRSDSQAAEDQKALFNEKMITLLKKIDPLEGTKASAASSPNTQKQIPVSQTPKSPVSPLIQFKEIKIATSPSSIAVSPTALKAPTLPSIAFGKRKWEEYIGTVGAEPPLPADIDKILKSPCPFWPNKKVYETHLLTLIPQTVNGQPLTLKTLGELVQKPLHGSATKYSYFNLGEYKDPPAPASHWAILSRDEIPGSRNKSYAAQQQLVNQYPNYKVPHILDATVALFMEHVQSGARLYSDEPATYTRCQEKYNANWQLVVGGFAAGGLGVGYYSIGYESDGVGGQRK